MTRYIEVLADAGPDADEQERAEARAELVAALEELGVDEVRVRELPAPTGSKSGGLGTAEILVAVGPPLFAAVVAAFDSWAQWAGVRRVRVKIGEDEFEASRLSPEQRQALLDHFIARTTRAEEPPSGGA
ncbi:hypothetical protein OG625_27940 [Streptomyces sp. NBC_01351]|uniref:hypothetical protein n=1 Tax=Streptomyces sp. NBC_01351 TaxID=2903833 RepID=UPI002E34C782|nr:hypothetical protein [Streptomyces sp. NBC_01351]